MIWKKIKDNEWLWTNLEIMNKVILLNKRPVGKPTLCDYKILYEEIPTIIT